MDLNRTPLLLSEGRASKYVKIQDIEKALGGMKHDLDQIMQESNRIDNDSVKREIKRYVGEVEDAVDQVLKMVKSID